MKSSSRRPYILIVDDNRDLAKSVCILLKFSGFEVEAVHDGLEAIKAADIRRPEIVILDIGLPGLDGFQVAERMRDVPGLKDVLIIAMSAYDPDMFPRRSRGSCVDHYLVKPVRFENLISLIDLRR